MADGLDLREDSVISPIGVISNLERQLTTIAELIFTGGASEETERLWDGVQQDFVRLSAGLRGLTADLERKLALDERESFLEYKKGVTSFLERFAQELSSAGRRVRDALNLLRKSVVFSHNSVHARILNASRASYNHETQ